MKIYIILYSDVVADLYGVLADSFKEISHSYDIGGIDDGSYDRLKCVLGSFNIDGTDVQSKTIQRCVEMIYEEM